MQARLQSLLVILALTLLCPSVLVQAAPGANPAINAPYEDPDYEQWVLRFEQPGREIYDQRQAIVEAAGVKAGMAVADIGAGTGFSVCSLRERWGPAGRCMRWISRRYSSTTSCDARGSKAWRTSSAW